MLNWATRESDGWAAGTCIATNAHCVPCQRISDAAVLTHAQVDPPPETGHEISTGWFDALSVRPGKPGLRGAERQAHLRRHVRRRYRRLDLRQQLVRPESARRPDAGTGGNGRYRPRHHEPG